MYSAAVQRHIIEQPQAVSVISDARKITRAQLGADIDGLSSWLAREGLTTGDVVGLTISDEYQHLIAALSLMRLGCVQIILPSHEPAPYRANLTARARAVAVIAQRAVDGVAGLPTVIPDFSFRAPPSEAPPQLPAADAVSMYVTSSGTTGKAKFTPLTQEQLYFQSIISQFPSTFDILYRPSPIEYNNAKRHRLYVAALGGINVFAKESKVDIFETCATQKVTRLSISAAQAAALASRAEAGEGRLPPETCVRTGGFRSRPNASRADRSAFVEGASRRLCD